MVSLKYPVVISMYTHGAEEGELDTAASNGELLNYAIAEHVENTGAHSGDASSPSPRKSCSWRPVAGLSKSVRRSTVR